MNASVKQLGRYRYVRRRWWLVCTVIDAIGWSVVYVARGLRAALRLLGWDQPAPVARIPRSILIVQLDHLGDAIISLPMLRALRRAYPRARIDVLCGEWNAELFAACGHVDHVYSSRMNRFARSVRRLAWIASVLWWGWRLREVKYDVAIDVRGELPLALLMWLSGARRRVGWAAGGGGFLLTDSPRWVPRRAEHLSRRALLAILGIHDANATGWSEPAFVPSQTAREQIDTELSRVVNAQPLIVFHVAAGTPAKEWPRQRWAQLAERAAVEFSAKIVLVGAAADRDIAMHVTACVPPDSVVDRTGAYGITQLAALLERAGVFVGADSGPAHLSAAVGTPTVVLFSGTNRHEQWQPRGRHVMVVRHAVDCSPCHRTRCPLADHPCLSRLSVDDVLAAMRELCAATRLDDRLDRDRPRQVLCERPSNEQPLDQRALVGAAAR